MRRQTYIITAGLALAAAVPAQAVSIYVRPVAVGPGKSPLKGFDVLTDFNTRSRAVDPNQIITGGSNGPSIKSNPNVAGFEPNQDYLEMKNGTFTQLFAGGSAATPGIRVFSFLFSGLDAGTSNNMSWLRINFVDRQGNVSFRDVADLQATFGGGTGRAFINTRSRQLRITSAVFTADGAKAQYVLDGFATAVPEPATWGMLILGFGMAGGALRRRSKAPVAA